MPSSACSPLLRYLSSFPTRRSSDLKFTCAKVLRDVSYRAIHIFGSLGVTDLTPLHAMWSNAPTMAVMDGVDEVHKVVVANNVLKDYRSEEHTSELQSRENLVCRLLLAPLSYAISPLSLHDALPISSSPARRCCAT